MFHRPLSIIFLLLPVWLTTASLIVFQGRCTSSSVFCEQVCIPIPENAYECGCYNGYSLLQDGFSCIANGSKLDVKNPRKGISENQEGKAKALGFFGDSYLRFPSLESAYLETNITIEFRFEESADGILLFAGAFKDSDFIAIAIKNDSILLRFDCGEGTVEDLYRGPLEKNVWHSLHVFRKFCARSEIQIDNRSSMTDDITELVHYKGITVDEGIFIGGAPKTIERLEEKAGTTAAFTGCVRRIVINGMKLFDSKTAVNLAEDEPRYCKMKDVQKASLFKSGKSVEENETRENWQEELQDQGYSKFNLSSSQDIDEKKPSEKTFELRSAKNVGFNGNSHVRMQPPSDIDRYMELRFSVKPKEPNGILYFDRSPDHFLMVYLKDAYVHVVFSVGLDDTSLRSEFPVAMNAWKRIEVWKSGKAILLRVADQMWIENRLLGKLPKLANTTDVYFGGTPAEHVPIELASIGGFVGCLKKVHQNGRILHLLRDAIVALNIHDCGWNPCFDTNCGGDAKCLNVHTQAICVCRFPLYGTRCDRKNDREFGTRAMKFTRYSYLRFASREVMDHVMGETLNLHLFIRLDEKNNSSDTTKQILVYSGSGEVDGDYLKLELVDNVKIELSLELGSGVSILSHPTTLSYESWHEIVISRKEAQLSLMVDDVEISTTTPGDSIELNVYDSLFIGGAVENNMFMDGFEGCIRDIRIESAAVSHPEHATEAINLSECT